MSPRVNRVVVNFVSGIQSLFKTPDERDPMSFVYEALVLFKAKCNSCVLNDLTEKVLIRSSSTARDVLTRFVLQQSHTLSFLWPNV